jgi:hypothetical protein
MRVCVLLRAFPAVAVISICWCAPLAGQWLVAAEVGAERFWGGSVENAPEHRSFRPYRPTTFGLGLERRTGRWGIGLRLRYMAAGLGLEGRDAVVAVKGVFDVYSAAPEIVYRVVHVGSNNQLLVRGGPLVEAWSFADEESRVRVGIQAGLSFTVPLGSRFAGTITGGVAVSASPFEQDQLLAGYVTRTLWRRGLAARLEYRLGARSWELE